MSTAAILLSAYLIGSIPFSYLVTRIMTGKDIRNLGSKNVGATNVMRTTGKIPGLIALVLDFLKGAGAVLLGRHFFPLSQSIPAACGFLSMIGHSYSLFLNFKGGKSVATGAGSFIVLAPLAIVSSLGVFAMMLFGIRIVSLASITGSAAFPVFAWLYGSSKSVIIWGALSAGLIIFRHHANIVRLFQGTERKMGASKSE